MKQSTLQSLIRRNANEIMEFEYQVWCCKNYLKALDSYNFEDWEVIGLKQSVRYYKQRLPKLREIQKQLKQEMAFLVGCLRLARDSFVVGE